MIFPDSNQELPAAKYSKNQIKFACSCGNTFYTSWSNYSLGKTKTCGSCQLYLWKKSNQTQFGLLTLINPLQDITKLTEQLTWKCQCGTIKKIKLYNVIKGATKSCGCLRKVFKNKHNNKYLVKSAESWLSEIPELVNSDLPALWSIGTNRIFTFKCQCGKFYQRKFNRFTSGTSTCGKCSEQIIKKGDIINKFIYDDEFTTINTNSTQKLFFICKCGKRNLEKIRNIFGNRKQTCGNCNLITAEELQTKKFGRLKIKIPIAIKRFAEKKYVWICDCGNECLIGACSVFNGKTRSCGRCRDKIWDWYLINKELLKQFQCPIQPGLILGGIEALEPIDNVNDPFKAVCPICKSIYYPRFHDIKNGESLTCGCTANQISLAQREITSNLQNIGLETILEYKINDRKYDIFVPESKLIIEFHGLKWHGTPEARKRDKEKYKSATMAGYDYVAIFEDEWRKSKTRVMEFLKNRLNKTISINLRPNKCQIQSVPLNQADEFFEKFHYIGKCKARLNYGVFFENQLIACIAFKRPTRQTSKYDFELVRMASDPKYRVHGIWSKLLKKFVKDNNPGSLVSFSDNRLFSGKVYEKMGFKFDGEIPPDYYWVKNKTRYHKSGLRKPAGTQCTEHKLRTEQGYYKIWDLGKKRWIFNNV
jgi:hypothetical protein